MDSAWVFAVCDLYAAVRIIGVLAICEASAAMLVEESVAAVWLSPETVAAVSLLPLWANLVFEVRPAAL